MEGVAVVSRLTYDYCIPRRNGQQELRRSLTRSIVSVIQRESRPLFEDSELHFRFYTSTGAVSAIAGTNDPLIIQL